MQEERSLRRDDFGWGVPVRLADHQTWNFPTPGELVERNLPQGLAHEYFALTRGVVEADSLVDLTRAELALAIFLLNRNYEMTPAACFQVLGFAPDDPESRSAQQAVHVLAMDHVKACPALQVARPPAQSASPAARTPRASFLRRLRTSMSA